MDKRETIVLNIFLMDYCYKAFIPSLWEEYDHANSGAMGLQDLQKLCRLTSIVYC